MKKIFFNESGSLNMISQVEDSPTYSKIMDDGYVDLEEMACLYRSIKGKFEVLEESLPDDMKTIVRDLIDESLIYNVVRDRFNEQFDVE